ncbi:outer membrane beta-barrel family protein [Daejeonella oryzae]|uniref:outer membrane beta-barrel family protein n=1 Tax=Daejeonella oryzae TaxID=1122943 RepID=UPI000426E739|nr:outer membrane beta-barrel family protein [Daejeonella oryzae]
MKRLLLLLTFALYIGTSFGQGPVGGAAPGITGKISGTIIDSITQQAVEYATVAVGRSGGTKTTNGSLTDTKGSFKVDNIAPGTYRVVIAFLGYETKVIDPVKTSLEKPDLNLGRIILSPNQKVLAEVQVTGAAAVIENKIDKIVYNAERDVTIGGGNAGDVLRKVPLLSVDIDGNVSLRGSQNVRVLINGKPSGSMANNMADALKMIPADQIKNVEVITSPSAKYDADGTSGIINIITKKKNVEGVSGSLSGGLGTRQNNGNANLNIKKGRLGLTGNFGGHGAWPQDSEVAFSQTDLSGNPIFNQTSTSEFTRLGFRGSAGADYDFNNFNAVNSSISFNRFGNTFQGDVLSTRYFGNAQQLITSNTDREISMPGFDWTTDYTRKFKKAGQELSFAAQLTKGKNLQDYTTLYNGGNNPDEIGNNDANNQEVTFQSDYVQPFKKVTLEMGAKAILRDITSNTEIDTLAGSSFVRNLDRSNIFDYNQDVAAGYTTLGFTLAKNYGVKVGGRLEYTKISGSSSSGNVIAFENDYYNFVPSLTLSRTFKNFQTVKISYNKRIQRPSLFYLNPFRNSSDPINQSQGNAYLEPEISNNVELGYSTFVKTTVINASLYYRNTQNIIESFITQDLDLTTGNTVNVQTFNNVGTNNSFGMNLFGSVNPVQKLTLRGNLNLNTYNIDRIPSLGAPIIEDEIQVLYNAFISGSMTFKGGFIAETFFILNSPRRTSQGTNAGFNMWNIGFKKEILKKKGSIGLNIIDPFNERKNFRSEINGQNFNQSSNFSIPFRSVGVNFSWQFGKMNFNATQRKKRVNNDDLKQGDQGAGNQ